jgi:hypothetical protein
VGRIESGEDVAEMIMRRSAVEEWPEPPEKLAFPATEPRDLDEGIGSGKHRQQGQQEYLIKWIHDLAALTWIWHIIEIIEKYDRFGKCSTVCRCVVHGRSPPTESGGSS